MRLLPAYLWPRFLKRRLPTSLWGRSLLIIVLPVLVMQVAVTWAFFDAHWQTVTSRLSDGLAGDIAWVSNAYERDPAHFDAVAQQAEDVFGLSVVFQKGRDLPLERGHSFFAAIDRSVDRALNDRLDRPYWFDTVRYPAYVDIRVETRGGGMTREAAPDMTEVVLSRLGRQIAGASHQAVSREQPLLSASLPGGERVQVIGPPATRGTNGRSQSPVAITTLRASQTASPACTR